MFLAVEVVVDLEEGDPSHHCLSPQSKATMVLTASPLTEPRSCSAAVALLARSSREAAGDVR